MITLWYTKVMLGMCELEDVRERYREQVLERLVEDGLYDEEGNRL